jgi:ABC-type Fe3+/spermidine/putrescine transport system ATPase subunit
MAALGPKERGGDIGRALTMLIIKDVSLTRGSKAVLSGICLHLEQGQRLVLIGPSGCGKTTLLRIVAGFIPPDQGQVLLFGKLASDKGRILIPPEHRDIGFVFQDLALWPHMTVLGNLDFGLKARRIPRDERRVRIAEIISMTALEGLEHRRPHELSGGQQQRVALARALVTRPRLLLLDEPLSSLDEPLKVRLVEMILALQGELGFSMIHVTHDMSEAKRLGQRIMSLERGCLRPLSRIQCLENSVLKGLRRS